MHYTDNAHSLRRVADLMRLYYPGIKPGLIITAVTPALIMLLGTAIGKLTGSIPETLVRWPIFMLLYLSPVMLTRRDYRAISGQLPVTATEKLGFLLIMFVIIVPAIILLSVVVGILLSILIFGMEVSEMWSILDINQMSRMSEFGISTGATIFSSCLTFVAFEAVVLYYVVTSGKNRVLAAIVAMFAFSIVLGLMGGIAGATIGFIEGFKGASESLDDALVQAHIRELTIWVLYAVSIFAEVVGLVYMIKLYRRLRNCGF